MVENTAKNISATKKHISISFEQMDVPRDTGYESSL